MPPFAFLSEPLDRRAAIRDDERLLAAALANPDTRMIVFSNGECLLESPESWRLRLLGPRELAALDIEPRPPVFLGVDPNGRAFFAIEVDTAQRERIEQPHFVAIWREAGRLPEDEAAMFAYAKGMLEWHARHRYCGRTGTANAVASAGHRLLGGEEHVQFPRVDPAIIVLVHRDDECLLGRKAGWPEHMYATIAGFVEPGESLEAAVRREVKEETDVAVEKVTYIASQPWPFPSQLMVGFHARAASHAIALNDKELADARWFTREEIASGGIRIPPTMSIAFHLIERWFDRPGSTTLRDLGPDRHWGG
jgi:NAD+ diphosphatase